MTRYQTSEEKKQQIRNAVMGNTGIHIDLITCVDSDSPEKYYIKHGNYSPAIEGYPESSDSFFITGQDDGFPNGFQTISDVQKFVAEEIERIKEKKTESIIGDDFKSTDGVHGDRWTKVLKAWELFQEKLERAIENNEICDYDTAVKLYQELQN